MRVIEVATEAVGVCVGVHGIAIIARGVAEVADPRGRVPPRTQSRETLIGFHRGGHLHGERSDFRWGVSHFGLDGQYFVLLRDEARVQRRETRRERYSLHVGQTGVEELLDAYLGAGQLGGTVGLAEASRCGEYAGEQGSGVQ